VTESLASSTAVILAGGLGTRLQSVVGDRPKVLAPVAGRPYLSHLFDQLAELGVRRVVLCTGYRADQIFDNFGSRYRSLDLVYSEETRALDTAGALRLALPLLSSPTVLVLNGDSYCAADLGSFWDWHIACDAGATLLLTRLDNAQRYGRVELDARGRVVQFLEKGDSAASVEGGLINAGVYLLRRDRIASIPNGRPVSLERELFPVWIADGLYGFATTSAFIDIGVPDAYAAAEAFFRGLSRESAPVHAPYIVASEWLGTVRGSAPPPLRGSD